MTTRELEISCVAPLSVAEFSFLNRGGTCYARSGTGANRFWCRKAGDHGDARSSLTGLADSVEGIERSRYRRRLASRDLSGIDEAPFGVTRRARAIHVRIAFRSNGDSAVSRAEKKGSNMEQFDRHHSHQHSVGPFVTASGRRLPVRTLAFNDVPALIEFSDYLARRSSVSEVTGFDRPALEGMTEARFNERTMIGLSAGPRPLLRAVGSYDHTSGPSTEVRFTVDNSLLTDGVFCEMVYRIAESAREHQITELRAAGSVQPAEREALKASGFPVTTTEDGHLSVDITDPR